MPEAVWQEVLGGVVAVEAEAGRRVSGAMAERKHLVPEAPPLPPPPILRFCSLSDMNEGPRALLVGPPNQPS